MEIREATPQDRPAIRDVARRSLQSSYSLEPKAIVGAIEEWYDENRLRNMFSDAGKLLLVAEANGQVVAFSDSIISGDSTGEILWLHVDPDYRGEDYGEQLFEATRAELGDRGATTLQGRVLADNAGGNAFYEERGLSKIGEEEVDIDGTPYTENIYAEIDQTGIEELQSNGETVYINHNNTENGSIAPFHVVFNDPEAEEIHGYWCSKCDTLANAMDAMGRIQCDACGNARKPTRWDSAYL